MMLGFKGLGVGGQVKEKGLILGLRIALLGLVLTAF
jgi:hypothetical protein